MSHPDEMNFKSGGGCLALFGLPFLLMCLLFVVLGFQGKMKTESGRAANPWVVLAFTTPFLAISGAMVFGRKGVTVDRRRGAVISWWGVMLPMRTKRDDLREVTHVSLRREVMRSPNYRSDQPHRKPTIVFPVELAREGENIDCETFSDYTKARSRAEELAKFTGLELHDSTGNQTVVHKPDLLDESVPDRAKRLDLAPEWPELPTHSEIQYETVGESAVIRLPAPGVQWTYFLMTIPALLFAGFVVFNFIIPFSRNLDGASAGFTGFFHAFMSLFIILPLGATLLPALRGMALRETVAASWQGIQVERKGLIRSKKWTFPANELEEMAITRTRVAGSPDQRRSGRARFIRALGLFRRWGETPGLRLRSDRNVCTLAVHLNDDELEWLKETLNYILVHRP